MNGCRRGLAGPKRLLGRLPRAAYVCAFIAFLNAVCWSFITPPFQTVDEPDHFAYVKQLAETGRRPTSAISEYPKEELAVLEALRHREVKLRPQVHPIATAAEQRQLRKALSEGSILPRNGSPDAGVAQAEPPLYYALETIPYRLADGGNLLDRLQLMRLMSALFAGFTAVFVLLFVREALPGARPYWVVGGLAVALSPLLGQMSGSVNPDSMLFAISAAIFYLLARSFHHGFTMTRASGLGILCALGFLTKLNFVGLAPGILLGVALLSIRTARDSRRGATYRFAVATSIALSPIALHVIATRASGHSVDGTVSSIVNSAFGSLWAKANYTWQLYLPRLPGTVSDFPGTFTTRQFWFNGFVGCYGWLDTTFPEWVNTAALIPSVAIVLLAIRSVLVSRSALRRRLAELVVYVVMGVGLMILIGVFSYSLFPAKNSAAYTEVRYFLPLLPLFAGTLVLAARGVGRRWGPVAGTLIVVLFLAHDIFSQLQVIARYYG